MQPQGGVSYELTFGRLSYAGAQSLDKPAKFIVDTLTRGLQGVWREPAEPLREAAPVRTAARTKIATTEEYASNASSLNTCACVRLTQCVFFAQGDTSMHIHARQTPAVSYLAVPDLVVSSADADAQAEPCLERSAPALDHAAHPATARLDLCLRHAMS